jgi:hypothetical protein
MASILKPTNCACAPTTGAVSCSLTQLCLTPATGPRHTCVALEAVHLSEQLVDGLLALIIAATQACTTLPAHGINLINEDDARGLGLGLCVGGGGGGRGSTHSMVLGSSGGLVFSLCAAVQGTVCKVTGQHSSLPVPSY